jgi:hypothetical protein
MPSPVRVLYHWTHKKHLKSILALGLDPSFASGEMWAVWGCTAKRIDWARDHVCSRHRWSEDDVILLRCMVGSVWTYRTCWDGVYYTPGKIDPELIQVVDGPGQPRSLTEYLLSKDEPSPYLTT